MTAAWIGDSLLVRELEFFTNYELCSLKGSEGLLFSVGKRCILMAAVLRDENSRPKHIAFSQRQIESMFTQLIMIIVSFASHHLIYK